MHIASRWKNINEFQATEFIISSPEYSAVYPLPTDSEQSTPTKTKETISFIQKSSVHRAPPPPIPVQRAPPPAPPSQQKLSPLAPQKPVPLSRAPIPPPSYPPPPHHRMKMNSFWNAVRSSKNTSLIQAQ